MLTTVTVNQWVIKSNAENGENKPAVCLNTYVDRDRSDWGEHVAGPTHVHEHEIPLTATDVKVVHDPINKTPCGASCWMEYKHA